MNSKQSLVLFLALLPLLALAAPSQDQAWKDFKSKHNKRYANPTEEAKRRTIFEERLKKIEKHNAEHSAGRQSYELGVNEFADQTLEELNSRLGARVPVQRDLSDAQVVPSSEMAVDRQVASEVDLRTSPCMSPIKDQSACGSCWAFAATNILEFAHCTKYNLPSPVLLSEQNLVDCTYTRDGCNGGFYSTAWLNVNNTASSANYPYTSGTTKTWNNGTCKFTSSIAVTRATTYSTLVGETGILSALNKRQPVAVCLQAVGNNFFFYKSGIYNDIVACNSTVIGDQVNHAVTLVGYNNTNTVPYWIMRNSWGTTWGQNGYMYLQKGINLCNIGLWGRGNLQVV